MQTSTLKVAKYTRRGVFRDDVNDQDALLYDPNLFKAGNAVEPVILTFSASITIDLETGNAFDLIVTGNTTINAPVKPLPGQEFLIRLQKTAGTEVVTWNSIFQFPKGGTEHPFTATAGAVDMVACKYWPRVNKYHCVVVPNMGAYV